MFSFLVCFVCACETRNNGAENVVGLEKGDDEHGVVEPQGNVHAVEPHAHLPAYRIVFFCFFLFLSLKVARKTRHNKLLHTSIRPISRSFLFLFFISNTQLIPFNFESSGIGLGVLVWLPRASREST